MKKGSSLIAVCFGFATAVMVTGCAVPRKVALVETEITGYPENPIAVKLGMFQTVGQDRLKGRIDFKFSLGGHNFTGEMQTIDDSVTTTGREATASRSASAAVVGGTTAQAASRTKSQTASTSTTAAGSSNGFANAFSDKGLTMKCEFVSNNKQLTSTGQCEMSNGAKYRFYAKPLRTVFTDGTVREM